MPRPETQRDYFAELYVAGIFGDAGWAVYLPKRDVGFDFVVSKEVSGTMLLRPVQVKGLYPTQKKTDKAAYGFTGELTATHPEMVLVLPFFAAHERGAAPAQGGHENNVNSACYSSFGIRTSLFQDTRCVSVP